MKVSIKAQIFLSDNLSRDNKKYCLISLRSGGCQGIQYQLLFVDIVPTESIVISPNIYIDPIMLDFAKDLLVDLQITNSSKKIIIRNLQATSMCSCGMSFAT